MTIASDLLQRDIQTLVGDKAQWQTLIADDLVWELPYAPAISHPARLSGREDGCGTLHMSARWLQKVRMGNPALTVVP